MSRDVDRERADPLRPSFKENHQGLAATHVDMFSSLALTLTFALTARALPLNSALLASYDYISEQNNLHHNHTPPGN